MSAKKGVSPVGSGQRRKRRSPTTTDILDLVKEGVERFILKGASLGEFQRAVRAAAKRGEQARHPITAPVFRRIVKRAIQERKRRLKKTSRPSHHTKRTRDAEAADRDH